MTTLIPISAVRFLQVFKTRRCAKQDVITKLVLLTPMVMPYFIKSKLFTVSAWESLHLGLTARHFQGNKFQVSEHLTDGYGGFWHHVFPVQLYIKVLVAAVWNQRVPTSDGPMRGQTPLPPSFARASLRPGTSCTGYSWSMEVRTEKICLAAALQAAEHQSRSQLNKYPSDINLEA